MHCWTFFCKWGTINFNCMHVCMYVWHSMYYKRLRSNVRGQRHSVETVTVRKSASPLPTSTSFTSLADRFASFVTDKISKLRLSLGALSTTTSPHSPAPSTIPPIVSLLSSLPLKLKSQRSFSTFLTNNLILILSQPGFLRNVLQSLFPLSLT